jgi:hypothetical protein
MNYQFQISDTITDVEVSDFVFSILLQECILGALKDKTVLLVTHQVDFLHNVDSIMVCIYSRDPKTFEFFFSFCK